MSVEDVGYLAIVNIVAQVANLRLNALILLVDNVLRPYIVDQILPVLPELDVLVDGLVGSINATQSG